MNTANSNNHHKYIVGLPRSRTYWLSALLQAHNVSATHELVTQVASKGTYIDSMDKGTIDCTSLPYITKPQSIVVRIVRPMEDVATSLGKLPAYEFTSRTSRMLTAGIINQYLYRQCKQIPKHLELKVNYDDLNNNLTVMRVLHFLGIEPELTKIKSFQPKVLTAEYMRTSTMEELEAIGQEVNDKFYEGKLYDYLQDKQ